MNARIAGNVGTPQLKQFLMVNIKTEFLREYTDQVISGKNSTECKTRASWSGPQASSTKLLEPQAASIKPQAQRLKLQAASSKLLDLASWKKFQAPLIKGLYQDK